MAAVSTNHLYYGDNLTILLEHIRDESEACAWLAACLDCAGANFSCLPDGVLLVDAASTDGDVNLVAIDDFYLNDN
jgi:hypothetical protein